MKSKNRFKKEIIKITLLCLGMIICLTACGYWWLKSHHVHDGLLRVISISEEDAGNIRVYREKGGWVSFHPEQTEIECTDEDKALLQSAFQEQELTQMTALFDDPFWSCELVPEWGRNKILIDPDREKRYVFRADNDMTYFQLSSEQKNSVDRILE